jgi:hypothetical protein
VENSHQGLETEVSGETFRFYKELKKKNDIFCTLLPHTIKRISEKFLVVKQFHHKLYLTRINLLISLFVSSSII